MGTQGSPAAGVFADDVRAWLMGGDGLTPASASNPIPVGPGALPAGTSRSGAIATGGTAQDLAAANSARKGLTGQNISSGDLWVNENGGTAAADSTDAYRVPSGAMFTISTNEKVSIVGATTGQKFTATEV
jgi:hypothetical protein